MSGERHEHGSGVAPMGEYAPGSRLVTPSGLSRGVAPVHAERYVDADVVEVAARQEEAPREGPAPAVPEAPRPRGRPRKLKLREGDDGPPDAA